MTTKPANDGAPTPLPTNGSRRTWTALAGLLLTLAGPVTYMFLLAQPSLRTIAAVGLAVLIVGVVAGWIAATRDRRKWVRGTAIFNTLLLGLVAYGLYGLAALPESSSFATMTTPPDFTLPDEAGRPVTLSEAYAAGPVLLVFYRGFW